jgi:transposase
MSEQERQLKALFEMVEKGCLTQKKVAEQINLSYRQIKRLYKRYQAEGDAGLVHKARGRISNRKHPHQEEIIKRYQTLYEDFGPTLATEKLMEEGFTIHHETLRQWLLSRNIWQRKRKRKTHRQRRERKAQFGELVQMDGSVHDWFGEDKLTCLINMVDDATGKTLSLLDTGETTEGIFRTLQCWVERYGIPLALYVDLKNAYISHKNDGWSHFQLACAHLGIQLIKAYSPQAKGRVERNHAVYQDRFVKEIKLRGIKTIEGGNALLFGGGFTDNLNKKFEKIPRCPLSAHRSSDGLNLNNIFCWEYQRVLMNDWTLSFHTKLFQITKAFGDTVRPKSKITIKRHLNGALSFWYKEAQLSVKEIIERPEKTVTKLEPARQILSRSEYGRLNKTRSPWRQFNPQWLHKPKVRCKEGEEALC